LSAQTLDAFLTSIAALGTGADKMLYTTGVDTAAEITTTSFGRSALTDADAAAARTRMGKMLPRYGLLGAASTVNMNSGASDNAITIESARYRIDKVVVENASINLTTATAGMFTAAGGGGTTLAADQVLTALNASTKFLDLTLGGGYNTDVFTAATLYFRVGTAQGAAATANVWIFGWRYD
jgi:hypothetical protein